MKAVTRSQIELAKPDSKWVRAEEAEQKIKELKAIAIEAPELNMGNYSDEEVGELNNAMIEIHNLLNEH